MADADTDDEESLDYFTPEDLAECFVAIMLRSHKRWQQQNPARLNAILCARRWHIPWGVNVEDEKLFV